MWAFQMRCKTNRCCQNVLNFQFSTCMGRSSRTKFNHGHIMPKSFHFEFRFSICYISPADVMGNMTLSMRMTICPLEDFFIQHLLHVHRFHEHTPYFLKKLFAIKRPWLRTKHEGPTKRTHPSVGVGLVKKAMANGSCYANPGFEDLGWFW